MKLIGIIDEDFINYKKISLTLEFPYCSFKCNDDWGCEICQNSHLQSSDLIEVKSSDIILRYINNLITESIVMQGFEPFDSFDDVYEFIQDFRLVCNDDIVIYTGYYESEISDKLLKLKDYNNIIIKFGRYIPDQPKHFDSILGVNLASLNQYAKRLDDITF